MELLEQLELVEVTYDNQKAVLVFLDEERGELREINLNKQSYDQESGKFIDDEKKAERIDEVCEEHFGLTFEKLSQAVGERKDIYAYDTFNSLYEVDIVNKFDKDDVGQIMEVEVVNVEDDGIAVRIQFDHEGKKYESRMGYSDYIEDRKEWFVNPIKRNKQYEKFEDKFGISIEDKDELVGQNVMVEVKLAFGKFPYVEIKPLKKKK